MLQRHFYFLVVFSFIFIGEIFGQENTLNVQKKSAGRSNIIRENKEFSISPVFNNNYTFTRMGYNPLTMPSCYGTTTYMIRMPVTYIYNKDIGWFCKKELQLDKITAVPLRFRLGSLEYVNWLEQKPNALIPR